MGKTLPQLLYEGKFSLCSKAFFIRTQGQRGERINRSLDYSVEINIPVVLAVVSCVKFAKSLQFTQGRLSLIVGGNNKQKKILKPFQETYCTVCYINPLFTEM